MAHIHPHPPRRMMQALVTAMAVLLSACVSTPDAVPAGRTEIPPVYTSPISAPEPAPHSTRQRTIASQNAPAPAWQSPPPVASRNQPPAQLEARIAELWRGFPGKTGIAVKRIDGGSWTIGQRGNDLFPQQSVSKTWVAITIFDQIDQGKLTLNTPVTIGYDDLAVFHSPIRDRVISGGKPVTESVGYLLEQALTKSDNTANDRLLWLAGGPDAVRAMIASKGLGSIRFGPGERLLQSGTAGLTWKQSYAVGDNFFTARAALPLSVRQAALDRYLADPPDGASPLAIVNALDRLARGELLSENSTRTMLGIMGRTTTGPNRIKGGLPVGWDIAHKTGTGQVLGAVGTGYNDIAIVTAPDGTRYAIAVLLSDTTAGIAERLTLMQNVSRAVAQAHQP